MACKPPEPWWTHHGCSFTFWLTVVHNSVTHQQRSQRSWLFRKWFNWSSLNSNDLMPSGIYWCCVSLLNPDSLIMIVHPLFDKQLSKIQSCINRDQKDHGYFGSDLTGHSSFQMIFCLLAYTDAVLASWTLIVLSWLFMHFLKTCRQKFGHQSTEIKKIMTIFEVI